MSQNEEGKRNHDEIKETEPKHDSDVSNTKKLKEFNVAKETVRDVINILCEGSLCDTFDGNDGLTENFEDNVKLDSDMYTVTFGDKTYYLAFVSSKNLAGFDGSDENVGFLFGKK